MATHSSVLAWRIAGTGEPGGLPSMESHRVGHDWSDLAAAAAAVCVCIYIYRERERERDCCTVEIKHNIVSQLGLGDCTVDNHLMWKGQKLHPEIMLKPPSSERASHEVPSNRDTPAQGSNYLTLSCLQAPFPAPPISLHFSTINIPAPCLWCDRPTCSPVSSHNCLVDKRLWNPGIWLADH